MTYTMAHFRRDYAREILKKMTPEDRIQGLSPEDLRRGLTPDQLLQGIPPEELVRHLSLEERLLGLDDEGLDRLKDLVDRRLAGRT